MKKMYEVPGFIEERPRRILELCEYLTPVMNEIHETDYSLRFWTTLLKDYAKTCVNRELFLSDKILKSRPLIKPMDGWELPTLKDKLRTRLRELAMSVYKRRSISEINRILQENDNICLGIRGKVLEQFGMGTYCPNFNDISSFVLNSDLRRKLEFIAKREEDVFRKNVILQLPRTYIEDFKKKLSLIDLYEPEKKIFHVEHMSGMADFIIAYYVEHGAKHYKYQLGAHMGEVQKSVTPEVYTDIDKLRTYGWKIHEKDEPHVAYRLEEFRRSYLCYAPKIHYDLCIVYNQVNNSRRRERYKTVSDQLFANLDFQKYSEILLRPRGHTRKISNRGELVYLNPPKSVTIDKGKKPMHEIVKASGIMVQLDLPSTNFLECVYVNHPIVAIHNVTNLTEVAKPYYRFFIEKNVMHKEMESLVSHLNTVDLNQWWDEVVSHSMYKEFKEKFARKV